MPQLAAMVHSSSTCSTTSADSLKDRQCRPVRTPQHPTNAAGHSTNNALGHHYSPKTLEPTTNIVHQSIVCLQSPLRTCPSQLASSVMHLPFYQHTSSLPLSYIQRLPHAKRRINTPSHPGVDPAAVAVAPGALPLECLHGRCSPALGTCRR